MFTLFTLRFFVLFFLLFLLFKPLMVTQNKVEQQPLVPILIDNSVSQTLVDSSYLDKVRDLVTQLDRQKLENVRFPLVDLQKATSLNDLKINSKTSDIQEGFETIDNLFANANVTGVVLITDGVINKGFDPPIVPFQVPIYSVFAGDTVKIPDAAILKVFHNNVVFKNNNFPVEVNMTFKKLKGARCNVSYWFGDSLLLEEVVVPKTEDFFLKKSLMMSSKETGKIPFSVKIKPFEKEVAKKNNTKTQFVNVLDGKRKVAIANDYLSPDMRAISRVLNKRDYDLEYLSFENASKKIDRKDLFILIGNSESASKTKLLNKLNEEKKGFIWFTGVNGLFSNEYFDFVRLDDDFDNVSAIYNEKYTAVVTSKNHIDLLSQLTPIAVPFGKWNVKKDHQNAVFQKVNGIPTNYPLVVLGENEYQKFTLFLGEGYWRWPLQKGGSDVFAELLLKHIEITADKSDQAKVQSKALDNYLTTEQVAFEVLAYNEARQLDNKMLLELVLNDSSTHQFLLGEKKYLINLGAMPEGVYSYKVRNKANNTTELSGRFIVSESILEQSDLEGKPGLLKSLAKDSRGAYFTLDQKAELVTKLTKDVNYTSISYFESSKELLLNNKWILYLLITLVAIEWFIRKWQGKI